MKKTIVVAVLIVTSLILLAACQFKADIQSKPTTDATITINTDSKRIRLIDDAGVEVGSLEFDEQVTVTIKRHRR